MLSKLIVVVAMLAVQAFAAIAFTQFPTVAVAGQSYNLGWATTGTGPVTINLVQGLQANLQFVDTLTTTGANNLFVWTVKNTYAPGQYALSIAQGTDVNYIGPITLVGGVAPSSVSVVASSVSIASAPFSVTSAASAFPTLLLPSTNFNNSMPTMPVNNMTSNPTGTGQPMKPSASIVLSNNAFVLGSPIAMVISAIAAVVYLQ